MLIGLDIGTSSVKGILATNTGDIVKTTRQSFTYTYKEGGGVEISADDYTKACFDAIRDLAEGQERIDALCASSASGNLLLLDRENRPLTPIFNWQDRRVKNEAKEILGEMDTDAFYRQTGWPFSYQTMPLSLLCYIKKHAPEKLKKCGKICMSTEYLNFLLTGRWGISMSSGTPLCLIDQRSGTYLPEILSRLGVGEEKLPPVRPCGTILGKATAWAEERCALKSGTPVVLGSFDHPSAARGVGVLKEGEMLLSCGTSWVAFVPVNDRSRIEGTKALIDPFLSEKNGPWGAMVSASSLSEHIKRYVRRYIDDSDKAYKVLSHLAENNTADGLTIDLREEMGEALASRYSKGAIARAIMEGAVRILKEKLAVLEASGLSVDTAVMVGGPSENPMWRTIIEEMCKIKVEVRHGAYAGAVGAAAIGGIGVGLFCDEKDASESFCKELK